MGRRWRQPTTAPGDLAGLADQLRRSRIEPEPRRRLMHHFPAQSHLCIIARYRKTGRSVECYWSS